MRASRCFRDRMDGHETPPVIGRAVPGDGRQPAAESGGLAEFAQALIGGHEHVLHHVVHLGARDAGQHDAVHHPRKALIELGKGVSVAGLGAPDQAGDISLGLSRRAWHLAVYR